MNTAKTLTGIFKNARLKDTLVKLDLGCEMNNLEQQFILECSLLLLNEYNKDKRKTTFLELAYYIILKYSLSYNDYRPLLEFSNVKGYYPIVNEIYNLNLVQTNNLEAMKNLLMVSNYNNGKYVQTLHQKEAEKIIIKEIKNNNYLYKAPTSFGKSEMMKKVIKLFSKVVILVPTKSLINQTYISLRQELKNYKFILHDSNYAKEKKFIMILTQERFTALMNKYDNLDIELIIVDEAHNIFNTDERAIILSRAIKKSYNKYANVKYLYLSPLVNSASNLVLDKTDCVIEEYKIDVNIKEPELYLYENNKLKKYNRFMNEYYTVVEYKSYLEFVTETQMKKNFIYIRKPKDIEKFAQELANKLPEINSSKLKEAEENLTEIIGEKFYQVELIRKGIIYIHGKLPESIKKYLEYKFKELDEVKYLIANEVVLEGVNTDVDNMYILQPRGLDRKALINLIGRVNRLNNIFNQSENKLEHLLPKIYFVDTKYNKIKMEKKIELLKSNVFKDKLKNPLLSKSKKKENSEILKLEHKIDETKEGNYKKLLESGINTFYKNEEELGNIYQDLKETPSLIIKTIPDVLELIYEIFIKNKEVSDNDVKRLRNEATRKYYSYLISRLHEGNFKKLIIETQKYHEEKNPFFYIGTSFGEVEYKNEDYEGTQKAYIDIKNKTDKEKFNLIMIKLELEKAFIHYKLRKFVDLLLSFGQISEEMFNIIIYGTNDKRELELLKSGIDLNLLEILKKKNLLEFMVTDNVGNIYLKDDIQMKFSDLLDYEKFQLSNYIR